jgi:16S rRNA (cytosine1402-N4)-methyltransferase
MTRYAHRPVLLDEVVELLRPVPPGPVLDATVGGGGHADAILTALPHVTLIGVDRDDAALTVTTAALAHHGDRVTLRRVRFDAVEEMMNDQRVSNLSGGLFDLGVSSPQLDRAERGFSYRLDAPLDMRMDRRQARTAADVVNGTDERALATLLRDNSDERYAGRIAKAIVAARPITSTIQLADIVRDAIPAPARRRGGHPAKRTFQALRIAVNDELDVLPVALDAVIARLAPGGRCVVISYHSGEDRIVKQRFRAAATGDCVCPPGLPCVCGATPLVRELRPLKRRPSAAEIAANPRAQSAILRAVEKLAAA